MPERVMLDPSLILDGTTIVDLLFLAEGHHLEGVAIPGEFVEMHHEHGFLTELRRFYGLGRGDDRLIELFMQAADGQLESYWEERTFDLFLQGDVADVPERILRVIAQEHAFLLSESWIFARVRSAFDRMIVAGSTAIELSKDRFDRVVRHTLKKDGGEDLTSKERLRALSKWTAASGPALLALFQPLLGAMVTSAAGVFLLTDP